MLRYCNLIIHDIQAECRKICDFFGNAAEGAYCMRQANLRKMYFQQLKNEIKGDILIGNKPYFYC